MKMVEAKELARDLQQRGFDLAEARVETGTKSNWQVKLQCSQCQALAINGIATHETGCPNTPSDCPECGATHPTKEEAARCCAPVEDDHVTDDDERSYGPHGVPSPSNWSDED